MFHRHPHSAIPHRWHWLSASVLALSAGSFAVGLALEDDGIAADCLPLAALPGLAAVIYWFNSFVYRINRGKSKDLPQNSPADKNGKVD